MESEYLINHFRHKEVKPKMANDISKMNLGELIAELFSTHDSIKSTFNINDGDPRAEEIMLKRAELQKYEKSLYEQFDKKEEQYNSYKNPPKRE